MHANDKFLQFENRTTGIKNLASTFLSLSFKLCIPTVSVLTAFEEQAASLFARQQASPAETDSLAALRDMLLPTFISGVLRVPTASSEVEL